MADLCIKVWFKRYGSKCYLLTWKIVVSSPGHCTESSDEWTAKVQSKLNIVESVAAEYNPTKLRS